MDEAERQAIQERQNGALQYHFQNRPSVWKLLNEDVPKLLDEVEQADNDIKRLKASRKRWRETCLKHGRELKQLRQDRDEWKAKADRLQKENEKLRETLKEIARQDEVAEGFPDADGVANYCIEEAREALGDSE